MSQAAPCPNCDALERELISLRTASDEFCLRARLGIHPGTARAILALFRADGVVSIEDLTVAASPNPRQIVGGGLAKVRITFARKALGAGAISTSRAHGYQLTPEGRQAVAAILAVQEPAEPFPIPGDIQPAIRPKAVRSAGEPAPQPVRAQPRTPRRFSWERQP